MELRELIDHLGNEIEDINNRVYELYKKDESEELYDLLMTIEILQQTYYHIKEKASSQSWQLV